MQQVAKMTERFGRLRWLLKQLRMIDERIEIEDEGDDGRA